eukprot:98995-Chlamydomonas_euryale.AAC.1
MSTPVWEWEKRSITSEAQALMVRIVGCGPGPVGCGPGPVGCGPAHKEKCVASYPIASIHSSTGGSEFRLNYLVHALPDTCAADAPAAPPTVVGGPLAAAGLFPAPRRHARPARNTCVDAGADEPGAGVKMCERLW